MGNKTETKSDAATDFAALVSELRGGKVLCLKVLGPTFKIQWTEEQNTRHQKFQEELQKILAGKVSVQYSEPNSEPKLHPSRHLLTTAA